MLNKLLRTAVQWQISISETNEIAAKSINWRWPHNPESDAATKVNEPPKYLFSACHPSVRIVTSETRNN